VQRYCFVTLSCLFSTVQNIKHPADLYTAVVTNALMLLY